MDENEHRWVRRGGSPTRPILFIPKIPSLLSYTNIVAVVVNRLRRKIDDGSANPLIHTGRGVGYVAKEPDGAHPG